MKWIISFVLGVLLASQISAQEVSVGVDVVSGYVDRGQVIGAKDKITVQPAVSIDFGDLSLGVLGNSFLQHRGKLKDYDEIELSGVYAFALNRFDLSAGIAHAFYFTTDSEAEESATELVGTISVPAKFSPVLSVSRNFSDAERWGYDWYISLSGSHGFYCVNLDAAIAGSDAGGGLGFDNVTGDAYVDIALGENITLSPGVTCAYIDRDTQHFVVGVGISF